MQELPLLPALSPLLVAALFLHWPLSVLSLLAGLFLWLRNPTGRPQNVSNFFRGFRFGGHRGSPINAPENTMASFKQAEREGVDLIEFDVGLTKDLVPVLMHDDSLERTTNMHGPLRDRTMAELVGCNCAANFVKKPWSSTSADNECKNAVADGPTAPAPIPRLEELVLWAKGRQMKMIFDVKDTDKALVEQLEQLFVAHDLFDSAIVCSFFPSVIYRIKRQNKHILTGLTWRRWFVSYQDLEWKKRRHTSPVWHTLAMAVDVLWMWSVKLWLPQFLGADMVLTERGEISENYVKFMRARGLEVCAWTVNDEREMAWMAQKLEIPFLTDVPHVARPVVEESKKSILLVN